MLTLERLADGFEIHIDTFDRESRLQVTDAIAAELGTLLTPGDR